MKETILDVLLYLFEHYFYDDPDAVRDRDSLQNGLIQAGFSPAEINKAFDWLDELANQRPATAQPAPTARCASSSKPNWIAWTWNAAAS